MTDQTTPPDGSDPVSTDAAREARERRSTMKTHHVLAVTSNDGDLSYSIECPGISRSNGCVRYDTCKTCIEADREAMTAKIDEDDTDTPEGVAHGVTHLMFEDQWWAPDGRCFAAVHDQLPDAAEMMGATTPGRYWVYVHCEDEYDLVLTSVNSSASPAPGGTE